MHYFQPNFNIDRNYSSFKTNLLMKKLTVVETATVNGGRLASNQEVLNFFSLKVLLMKKLTAVETVTVNGGKLAANQAACAFKHKNVFP